MLCGSCTWQIVKTRVIKLRVEKSPNARDQIAFCSFHSFSVEVQTNAGYIHETPCIIATCRLGLWVDLLQVDLLASGASLVAADRERRSRERSTCLAWWFAICISRQKWGVAWLAFRVSGFICESLTSMAECADSTATTSIERMCVSPSSKEQIC